jgi:uncharacterized protein (DUF433 family)
MQLYPHITADAGVLSGQPVVEGTAVPVSLLVQQVAAGKSLGEVARDQGITTEEVRAALQYAARLAGEPPEGVRDTSASTPRTAAGTLSPAAEEEARKMGLDTSNISPLGRDLLELRAQAAADGEQFLSTWEELDAEIADRRGGHYSDADE